LQKCVSKDEAVQLANQLWEDNKKDNEIIDKYIKTPPTHPAKDDKCLQKNLSSFFQMSGPKISDSAIKKDPFQGLRTNLHQPQLIKDQKETKKRKADDIDNDNGDNNGESKNEFEPSKKKVHFLYDLAKITKHLFEDENLSDEQKIVIQKELELNILSHEDLFISMTQFLEQINSSENESSFKFKETEFSAKVEQYKKEARNFSKFIKEISSIKMELKKMLDNCHISELANPANFKIYENDLKQKQVRNMSTMITMGSILSLILPMLSKRVSNVKYYKKKILALEIYNSPLKFFCFNLDSDWGFSLKLMNLIFLDEGNTFPLDQQSCIDFMNPFKDPEVVVLKLETIFNYLFPNDEKKCRSRFSKVQALNTIILKLFPILSFNFRGNIYIIDVTKLDENNESILDIFCEILEDLDLEYEKKTPEKAMTQARDSLFQTNNEVMKDNEEMRNKDISDQTILFSKSQSSCKFIFLFLYNSK